MTLLLPDLLILLLAALILGIDLYRDKADSTLTFHVCWGGLMIILFVLLNLPYDEQALYLGSYQVTGTALLFKQIFVLSALFSVLLSDPYFTPGGNSRGVLKYRSEFLFIILLCTFGMFTVVSATDLLTLFIGMELATIPLYIMGIFQERSSLC